jgi:hypothetical protein
MNLRDANELVAKMHRHHKPTIGHRFSLAVIDDSGKIRGAVIAGRPVSRGCNQFEVLEVTRLVTDGCANACSALYGAVARTAKAMGYLKVQTYTLATEPGTSLVAAGWAVESTTQGGQWSGANGKPRRTDQPITPKTRWAKMLNQPYVKTAVTPSAYFKQQIALWGD